MSHRSADSGCSVLLRVPFAYLVARLNLTKQQVQDLPPADIHHPNGESGARGTAVLTGPVAGQTGLRGLI